MRAGALEIPLEIAGAAADRDYFAILVVVALRQFGLIHAVVQMYLREVLHSADAVPAAAAALSDLRGSATSDAVAGKQVCIDLHRGQQQAKHQDSTRLHAASPVIVCACRLKRNRAIRSAIRTLRQLPALVIPPA